MSAREVWGSRAVARSDRGNAPLELLLIAPIILVLIGLVVAAGRVTTARGAVDAAAAEAARQASIAPTAGAAELAALSSATAALQADGLACQPIVTLPNLNTAFGTPLGQPAEVEAKVTCVLRLSSLLVPGVPGTVTLVGRFFSPLDPYRSRDLADQRGCHGLVTPPIAHSASRGSAASHISMAGPGSAAVRGSAAGHTSMRGAGCDETSSPVRLTVLVTASPVRSP
jgi:hypothetical protein